MNEKADTGASLVQHEAVAACAETARFEVRSVTGACYTIVEQTTFERRPEPFGERPIARRRYRTAYAGLPVAANDDGSFTIIDTHTRLVRTDAA
jgi:hypothetical protein